MQIKIPRLGCIDILFNKLSIASGLESIKCKRRPVWEIENCREKHKTNGFNRIIFT